MKLCPVAIAVGCRKCPVFKLCLVKGLVGDAAPPPAPPALVEPLPRALKKAPATAKPRAPAKARGAAVKRGPKAAAKGSEQGLRP